MTRSHPALAVGGGITSTIGDVNVDRRDLNLIAAVLCGVGSLAALVDGMSGWRRHGARASVLSGLFGTIGSVAWALSAHQDREAARAGTDAV